jgi:hypothetical protein
MLNFGLKTDLTGSVNAENRNIFIFGALVKRGLVNIKID